MKQNRRFLVALTWRRFALRELWELPDEVRKILGFLTPSTPCPHLDLIYTTKFTRPPLLRPLFHDLQCRHHIWKLTFDVLH